MNILFVCSGNKKNSEISPIISRQADSLVKIGISVSIFKIEGKGFVNYIRNRKRLISELKNNKYDVIHAHYSFSGILAAISTKKIPIITSLMGSDVKVNNFWKIIILFFNFFCWKNTIVKAERMLQDINLKNVSIIPNGVDFDKFKPIEAKDAKETVLFNQDVKKIIFVSDPFRKEKNFELANKAVELVQVKENVELFVVHFDHVLSAESICNYMNAADALLLTSFYEGSPNVIKEAMACNCPIVSTNVGDVKEVFGNTDGCYLAEFTAEDVAMKLEKAINFGKTLGRDTITHLDSHKIALQLKSLYEKVKQTN